jgi:hypothetical protein
MKLRLQPKKCLVAAINQFSEDGIKTECPHYFRQNQVLKNVELTSEKRIHQFANRREINNVVNFAAEWLAVLY